MFKSKNETKKIDASIPTFNRVENEYVSLIEGIGHPADCSIFMKGAENIRNYELYKVEEIKKTVSFLSDTNSINYKTLTHSISTDEEKFGLACDSNGKCEFYQLEDVDNVEASFIADIKLSKKIIDPVFAFKRDGRLIIVFNIPTQSAISTGAKGRKPSMSEDNMGALMSGCPSVVSVDIKNKTIECMSPNLQKMKRYTAFISHDEFGVPILIIGNILSLKKNNEQEVETIKSLFMSLFEDETAVTNKKDNELPFGIAVLELTKLPEANYTLVNPVMGLKNIIEKVDVLPAEENGVNNFKIVYKAEQI